MMEEDINLVTLGAVFSAMQKGECWEQSIEMLDRLPQKTEAEAASKDHSSMVICFNTALTACERAQQWPVALDVFQRMVDERLRPTVITWNSTMSACSSTLQWQRCLELLRDMRTSQEIDGSVDDRWRSDLFSYDLKDEWMLHACSIQAGVPVELFLLKQLGCWIWQELPTILTFNVAINSCQQVHCWPIALALMEEATDSQLSLDRISFTKFISSVGASGQWPWAMWSFEEMQRRKLKPSVRTYNDLMAACNKSSEFGSNGSWPWALLFFESMRREGLSADALSYNIALSACERATAWAMALTFLEAGDSIWKGNSQKALANEWKQMQLLGILCMASANRLEEALVLLRSLIDAGSHMLWLDDFTVDLHGLSTEVACVVVMLAMLEMVQVEGVEDLVLVTGQRHHSQPAFDASMQEAVFALMEDLKIHCHVELSNRGRVRVPSVLQQLCKIHIDAGADRFRTVMSAAGMPGAPRAVNVKRKSGQGTGTSPPSQYRLPAHAPHAVSISPISSPPLGGAITPVVAEVAHGLKEPSMRSSGSLVGNVPLDRRPAFGSSQAPPTPRGKTPRMPKKTPRMSPRKIAELPADEFEGKSVRELKEFLVQKTNGFTPFQQRLFREDGSECLDDAMLIPDTFQLVLLAYPPADWEEDQKLFHACEENQLDELHLLLRRPLNPTCVNDEGVTALHVAARQGHLECINLLVQAGAEIDHGPVTPLHLAARHGHLEACKVLLDYGAEKDKVSTENGDTALHFAAWEGHLDVVCFLLHLGASINIATKDVASTPLHLAATGGHVEMVRVMLANGAEKDAMTFRGATPLHWAVGNGHIEVVRVLLAAGAQKDRARKDDGRTPLHVAIQNHHLQVVSLLLEAGADYNKATTMYGATPLHWATLHGHVDAVRLLLAANADLDKKTCRGLTAMHLAVRKSNMELMRMLERSPPTRKVLTDEEEKRRRLRSEAKEDGTLARSASGSQMEGVSEAKVVSGYPVVTPPKAAVTHTGGESVPSRTLGSSVSGSTTPTDGGEGIPFTLLSRLRNNPVLQVQDSRIMRLIGKRRFTSNCLNGQAQNGEIPTAVAYRSKGPLTRSGDSSEDVQDLSKEDVEPRLEHQDSRGQKPGPNFCSCHVWIKKSDPIPVGILVSICGG
eukprot:symbB.v1.2.014013.t2/scaffold1012.1/size144332/6